METAVDRIMRTCRGKGIPVSKLERDLGFSNGYLGKLKQGTVPLERAEKIADYLGVPAVWIMKGDDPGEAGLVVSPDEYDLVIQYRNAPGMLQDAARRLLAYEEALK